MYQVYINDNLVFDIRQEELFLDNPVLNLEINKVGSFDFLIYPKHIYFDKIEKHKSKVSVKRNGKDIFRGRVIKDGQRIYNDKSVSCESAISYLNDSIFRPFNFKGTPEELFNLIFDEHNSQVDESRQLKIGIITVTDPNDLIVRNSQDYLKCFEVLKTRLFDSSLGGYIVERYEADGTYIDYLKDFNDTSTQEIQFGVNLIDIVTTNDASATYSVIIPLGAQLEEIVDEETNEVIQEAKRVTIESVNDGKDYLVNEVALNEYGWVIAPTSDTTWDDVTQPHNLLTKAKDYLSKAGVMMKSSIQLSAVDMNIVNKDIEAFFIYEYVRLFSFVHNLDKTYLLSKISIPLANPENMKITLGETINSFTGIQMGTQQKTSELINRVEKVEADYIKNKDLTVLKNETIIETTKLIQSSEEILLAAMQDYVLTGDFKIYQESISSQLNILADQIIAKFEYTSKSIEDLDDETRQEFLQLYSYIRGYMNQLGQPILELGSDQSELIVQVNNEGFQIRKKYNNESSEILHEFAVNGLNTNNVTLSGKLTIQNEVTSVINVKNRKIYITYIKG